MSILIVLAATAIAAIVATFITLVIVYKTDTDLHDQLDALDERTTGLETDLHSTKERVNADLVQLTRKHQP